MTPSQKPDFAYRSFYTWDHSTNWDLTQPGARLGGCFEPYGEPPEAFLADYTRLVDFMQWWGCGPRGTPEVKRFFHAFPLLRRAGFQGVCTHGEESASSPAAELNYHVFAALAEDAAASPSSIAERSVGALYGSCELAADILRALRDERVPRELPGQVAALFDKADGQARVRLNWALFELQRLAEATRR